jgi:hypothetical protein
MKDPVEAFMSDIAFDDGMGFGLGIGGPSDIAEDARRRLAHYVTIVRKHAAAGTADEEERKFRLALQERVRVEVDKTRDARGKKHLEQVLAVVSIAQ